MFVEKCFGCLCLESGVKLLTRIIIYILAPLGLFCDVCILVISIDGEFCWTAIFLHQHHKPTSPSLSEI
jgi:hypothetical protein